MPEDSVRAPESVHHCCCCQRWQIHAANRQTDTAVKPAITEEEKEEERKKVKQKKVETLNTTESVVIERRSLNQHNNGQEVRYFSFSLRGNHLKEGEEKEKG